MKTAKGFNWMYQAIALIIIVVLVGGGLGFALSSTSSKLDNTRNLLASTQTELGTTKNQLSSTQDELSTANASLAATQAQLSQTQTTLANTQGQLTSTQNQLSSTQDQLKTSQSDLAAANSQVSSLQTQLSSTQSSLSTTQSQVSSLQSQLAAKTLKYFANQAALATWLASQPTFSINDLYNSSVKLKNLATEAGYIMDVYIVNMSGTYYGDNEVCCADGNVYIVSPISHAISWLYSDGTQPTP